MRRDALVFEISLSLFVVLLVVCVDCACSKPNPVTGPPVIVENRCELPPKPALPTPKAHRPDDGDLICFTPGEANKLRERDAKLKQWVREVLARCSTEETKDAGSPVPKD